MAHISITSNGTGYEAKAQGYLGRADFRSFSQSCKAAGFRWNGKRGKDASNKGADVVGLATLLRESGIETRLDESACREVERALGDAGKASEKVQRISDWVERTTGGQRPYRYQEHGIEWLLSNQRGLLGDEMGLGKTWQALLAMERDPAALIVVPASLRLNWAEEIQRLRPDIKPVVYFATITKRARRSLEARGIEVIAERSKIRWPSKGEAVIVNYASSAAAEDMVGEPIEGTYLVADEIHKCKNRKAQRTSRFNTLRKAIDKVGGNVWGLTGTPLPNRPFDLQGVLTALGLFKKAFPSWPEFVQMLGGVQGRFGIEWTERVHPDVPSRLQRVMLRREADDVLDLPPVRVRDVTVDTIPEKAVRAMDAVLERLVDAGWDPESDVSILDYAGSIPFEAVSEMRALVASAKAPAALEIVEEYEEAGIPLVVFSAHRAPVDAIGAREGWGIITGSQSAEERDQAVRAFREGSLKGLAITIRAGGVGLNLQTASHVLFVDQEWTPADNEQALARVRRIGQQDDKIQATYLHAPHTIDRMIGEALSSKIRVEAKSVRAASRTDSPATDRQQTLTRLLDECKRQRDVAPEPRKTIRVEVPFPAGTYAVDKEDGGTAFWLIEKGKDGTKWEGFVFVKQVVSAGKNGFAERRIGTIRPDGTTTTPAAATVIGKIAKDPLAAAARFGKSMGRCGLCGFPLTNDESREAGIGPVCREKFS